MSIPLLHGQLGEFDRAQILTSSAIQKLHDALNSSTATDASVKQALLQGPSALGLLGDTDNDGTAPNSKDIVITHVNPAVDVELEMLLHEDLGPATLPAKYAVDLGLPALPVQITSTAGVQVQIGFDYELAFGWDGTKVFVDSSKLLTDFGKPLPAAQLSVHAVASLTSGSQLNAIVGFIEGTLADNGGTRIDVTLNANGLVPSGSPQVAVNGTADANLHLTGNAGGPNFPAIGTDLIVHCGFGSQNTAPTVQFNNVSVELGSVFHNVIGEVAQDIQKATQPIKPVLDLLTAPIPVLTDLSHLVGGPDITLLDIGAAVGGLNFSNGTADDVKAFAKVLKTIDNISNDINALSAAQGVQINLGSFDLGSNGDLRQKPAAKDPHSGDPKLTSLVVNDALVNNPAGPSSLQDFESQTQGDAHLSFPVLDDPIKGAFPLLLGQDVNLASFSAGFGLSVTKSLDLPTPIPLLQLHFEGSLGVSTFAQVAYDTFGLREFINSHNQDDLADGLYLAAGPSGTNITFSGSLKAGAQISFSFFDVGVDGGPNASITVSLQGGVDPNKIRLNELRSRNFLFNTTGEFDASLDAFVKIGVELPFVGFVGYEKDFVLSKSEPVDFTLSQTINPFNPPGAILAHPDPSDPTRLILSMGSQVNRNLLADANLVKTTSDVFTVTHVSGDAQNGETVKVSAFGLRPQQFPGVKTIVVDSSDGTNGNDVVTVGPGVTSDLQVTEGDGNNVINYQGTGTATITVGNGNNNLSGGSGKNTFRAGSGNNTLSGTGTNIFSVTGNGNNTLTGGQGTNSLTVNGAGSNQLVAGGGNDTLSVFGGGFDTITAGIGQDTVIIGGGTNAINWTVGDGNLTIHADGGKNSLQIDASNTGDTFTVSPFKTVGVTVAVDSATVTANAFLQTIGIDGGGADQTTINDLGPNTMVQHIGVKHSEALNSDGAKDVTTIQGNTDSHFITVSTEGAWFHPLLEGRPQDGGVMDVRTRTQYDVSVSLTNNEDDLIINAKGGGNAINVQGTTGHTVINAGLGSDSFSISSDAPTNTGNLFFIPPLPGPQNVLFGISGLLEIHAGPGANTLTVSESGETFPSTITLTDSAIFGSVQRSGNPAPNFRIQYGDLLGTFAGGINLFTGKGADTVNIQSVPRNAPMVVNTGGGADQVFAGDANNTLDSIRGPLAVNGVDSTGTLTLDDQGAAIAESYNLGASHLSRGAVQVSFSSFGNVDLLAGNHGNQIIVAGTAVGTAVQVSAGTGNDQITVGDLNHTLNEIGSLSIDGQGGNDTLLIDDSGTLASKLKYTLTATSFSSGAAVIGYQNVSTLNIKTGSAFGTFQTGSGVVSLFVQSTAAGSTPHILMGSGNNTIFVTPSPTDNANLFVDEGPEEVPGNTLTVVDTKRSPLVHNAPDPSNPGSGAVTVTYPSNGPIITVHYQHVAKVDALNNLSGSVQAKFTSQGFNATTQITTGIFTLTNTSTSDSNGPLVVMLQGILQGNLGAQTQLVDVLFNNQKLAIQFTPSGVPFFTIPVTKLAAGQSLVVGIQIHSAQQLLLKNLLLLVFSDNTSS